ncbi:universal stress protein [Natrarchaeobius halalkaliphilus]|uniref:Universal stress protein n=1 Tax=Natrarchaeobius halalkaliphilus TaxID=1679091 RepID=A0A3N6NVR6_9EURY|nr:universal stress protein [Natrarchaeobius halalkaliphilus]RQG87972.1 universal stress protein [Natrarchaeobius halalkaliphilus]
MSTHVLVPIDRSECSTRALEFALKTYSEKRITAITVTDPSDVYDTPAFESTSARSTEQRRQKHERRARTVLEDARELATDAGIDLETDHVIGGVSKTIIDYADEHDVDHIVVGSHGRTGASRILLGSIAETVARRSPVPVTIVR